MVKYSPIESEFASSEEEEAYDAWFRAKVERALQSTGPFIPHEEVMRQMREIISKYETPEADLD
ncbi:stability determinant [Blastomonas sp. UPD001]|jgi:predicted transcriptional regulator|uniref:type II toxin-antitoxin system RelB family antitoxin n=1 Tax=Blastomonas sp. UPD001 TaxID=2217673 RepID=UPI000E341818|nr:stability determinant [Blastomonas sp. UPD001]